MAKNDRDLFDRLRNAGLRKQVAKTLSGIGDDAGKKAASAARNAIKELRGLADDIESRLPAALTPGSGGSTRRARKPAARRATSSASTTRTTTRSRGATAGTARRAPARKPAAARKAAPARKTAGGRAPRGANKAKIIAALGSGPKTASEIAKQTGIGVGTVGSTLTKMTGSGEVQKAARGYQLPK
jgi:DNA-binding protein HU-beta